MLTPVQQVENTTLQPVHTNTIAQFSMARLGLGEKCLMFTPLTLTYFIFTKASN